MPKSRPPYPPEFRRRMVELVRSGRTPGELSRSFEPSAESIWNWVRQAERDEGVRQDGCEERLRHLPLQEPVPILRERRRHPDRIVDPKTHEPAVQQVVRKLLHQLALAA